eukprot:superscaffoldBa00000022_g438
MASKNTDSEKLRPRRRPWRKTTSRFSCRLFCCSCLQGEEKDPLQEQEKKINGGPQHPHMDQQGSGEKEAIQITVEDLGIVNASFSLFEEDPMTSRSNMARSASSVSACRRALKEKRLKPLSSLPIQPQSEQAITSTSGEDDEEEEEDPLLFESGTDSTPASGSLLTPPVINLIPPTPSDVVDDDQFFDINSEESVEHISGSEGSFATQDQESYEEKMDSVEPEESKEGGFSDDQFGADRTAKPEEGINDQLGEERDAVATKEGDKEKSKPRFLRSAYQVAPIPEYPQKNFSWKTQAVCLGMTVVGLGDTLTSSSTFHTLTQATNQQQEEEGSPRQRRITVASYMPLSKDQNGNFPEKDMGRQVAKSLMELNTDEVCQWFTSIGLQKCLPFIREAKLCGADLASVDMKTLDILHIATLEDREQLLSAIYNELHPPNAMTQRLDSLLESVGPNNVETFTAALVSMSKSKSSPHVSCLTKNRRSLKLRNNSQHYMVQRNSHLIEITINDSPKELSPDQQIKTLLMSTSGNRQLELHLCKMEKPPSPASQNSPEVNSSDENSNANKNVQAAKEERIRELKQQVDSLQNVILQVQELHHGLVEFCSELKNMDGDVNVDRLGSAELKQKLELVKSRLNDKRQSLQTLRDNINNAAAHKKKQFDVRLLEKMKLNCQVFKEEISMVHLNRQVAHLQNALQESYIKEKARKKSLAISSLGQLVSPQSPAMLLVVQETQGSDGCYGFTCHYKEGCGLVVAKVDNSHLCVGDRLVELNGVSVVNSTEEELSDLLLQGPSAQIVVLRQPPTTPTSQQHPLLLQHMVNPDPQQTICPEKDGVTTETPPQRKLMAI